MTGDEPVEKEHADVMKIAWKKVVDAYASHVGKDNMRIIMLRNNTEETANWEQRLKSILDDMAKAEGGMCPQYPESEVYDFYSDEGMHLLFPHYNMHYVFPDIPEESERVEGFTRVRAYGNAIAIAQIINANMEIN